VAKAGMCMARVLGLFLEVVCSGNRRTVAAAGSGCMAAVDAE
jgi:hypothetical protein